MRSAAALVLLLAVCAFAVPATATESRGPAQIFTGGDFNLSTTSATFTPDPSANGGYDVCTSSFSLFNTTAAQQVVLNNTDFTVFHLNNATFPYHNSSYTTFFIHALGYIYFSEAAALPLGTCTQHGHFFSADRIYAFCTGNGFVSNPSIRILDAGDSLVVEWTIQWQTCSGTPPANAFPPPSTTTQGSSSETPAPPNPPSPEAPPAPGAVSEERSFPVVVQARLGYDGSVSLNWNSARPCQLAVGLSAGYVPALGNPIYEAPTCGAQPPPPSPPPSAILGPVDPFQPPATPGPPAPSPPAPSNVPRGCEALDASAEAPAADAPAPADGSSTGQDIRHEDGQNWEFYPGYRCRVATLKYLPQALPGVSLFGGSSAAKQPIFVSNGFGNSSWGSYDTAMADAGPGRKLLQQLPAPADSATKLSFNLSVISLGAATSLTPWLVVNTSSVTLARDAVASVPLQYNTSTLAPGTYQSIVQISSNDPLMPVVNLTANLTNYCARFNGSEGANMASNVSFTGLFRDLPAAWQQEALPNDAIGTNWVYYEALVVSSSPVYQLTRDNLDPESPAGMGVVFTIQPAPLYGLLCGAWLVRGAFPLSNFYAAPSTSVNLTVSGLTDAFGRSQPSSTLNATYVHWPVCTMYGLDIGYGGDFGAVTQKQQALVMLACSAPLLQLEPACLFANATEDAEGAPLVPYVGAMEGSTNYYQAVVDWQGSQDFRGPITVSWDPSCNATDASGQALAPWTDFTFNVASVGLVSPAMYRLTGAPVMEEVPTYSMTIPGSAQPFSATPLNF